MTLMIGLMLVGCMANSNPELKVGSSEIKQDSAVYYFEKIDSATATELDLKRASSHFISEDSLVKTRPDYLMKAGLVLLAEDTYRSYGLNYLILLTNKFPEHPYAPEALMQLGLFFENVWNDSERSMNYLRALIDRYPNHPLSKDAMDLLNFISVSESGEIEMVNDWLKNN
jgi:hypothetical protein